MKDILSAFASSFNLHPHSWHRRLLTDGETFGLNYDHHQRRVFVVKLLLLSIPLRDIIVFPPRLLDEFASVACCRCWYMILMEVFLRTLKSSLTLSVDALRETVLSPAYWRGISDQGRTRSTIGDDAQNEFHGF